MPQLNKAAVPGAATDVNPGAILNLGEGRTATERAKTFAAALIGTRYFPPGFVGTRQLAMEAQAYHNLRPYPYWQFADWKTEERGPLPRCLPTPQRIVRKSATWLFGKPVQINVPGNKALEKYLREQWQFNRMPTRMVAAAEQGGYQGGVALKWSYDETADPKLSFQILSIIDECRLFYDPHDSYRLLMARVQYPAFNPLDGETYLYREEWTDEEEVHYEPVLSTYANVVRRDGSGLAVIIGTVPVVAGTKTEPDNYLWKVTSRKPNPFGVIPLWPLRNRDVGSVYGAGDLWTDGGGGLFRIIDRLNLTFHLMDKSNQFDTERNLIFIDVNAGPDAIDRPLAPGQPASLKSDPSSDGGAGKGQVIQLEASGNMRPHMMGYAAELRYEIISTVGSVDVRPDEVGNKGAMTEAVMTQLYLPLIETTEAKRKTYGEDGICKFLERLSVGMKNAGTPERAFKGVNADNLDTHDVQLTWPDFFQLSEEEKTTMVTRVNSEVDTGYMTHERAVEIIGQAEGIEDIPKLKSELEKVGAAVAERQVQANGPRPEEPDPNAGQPESRMVWNDGE